MYNTKNYMEDGGNKLVIGGTLEILPTANIIGLAGNSQCEYQPNSEASTITQLKNDLNALMQKLREAGLMAESSDN